MTEDLTFSLYAVVGTERQKTGGGHICLFITCLLSITNLDDIISEIE